MKKKLPISPRKTLLLMLVCFVASISHSSSQIITTIAGNGTIGYSGDGGPATAAELYDPVEVVPDAAGNLYVVEWHNNTVRKINTSGIISTIAGTGIAGFSGDGGPATAARLNSPVGVFVDGSGNVYIGDYSNHRIRKVNTSGIITTIAGTGTPGYSGDGGSATAAQLRTPMGIYVDATGKVYFADSYYSIIRCVDLSGNIATIAGTGTNGYNGDGIAATSARLFNPYGVTMDGAGNLYIADQNNHRVRKVDPSGIISTVAGNGTPGFLGDGGAATAASLNNPSGVYFDIFGSLLIADQYNDAIRKVALGSGIITTITGTGVPGYSGDGGLATAAQLNHPPGVCVNSAYNIFIADGFNQRIRKIGAAISGPLSACVGNSITLSGSPSGGTWASSNPSIATVGSSTGVVTGIAAGFVTISYFTSVGTAITTITVNPLPALIGGPLSVCEGSNITLTNTTPGGTWSSTNTNATVGSTTGIVNGVTAGAVTISYTLPTGCYVTKLITVNPTPPGITGGSTLCDGSTGSYACGGVFPAMWTSTGLVMTIGSATGIVTAITSGIGNICYTYTGTGCSSCKSITVNPVPSTISGLSSVCVGSTIPLSSATPGGLWSTSNGNATIGSTTGTVNGVTAGAVTITYTLGTGCYATKSITVNPLPATITGTLTACSGSSGTAICATPGGSWTSSSPACVIINPLTGLYTILATCPGSICYTLPTGCSSCATVTSNPVPAAYSVTGGGGYCSGLPGLHVGLSGSAAGVSYELYRDGITTGIIVAGTGGVLDFGVLSAAGTYTVVATIGSTGCTRTMFGSAIITVLPTPVLSCGPTTLCPGSAVAACSPTPGGGTWASSNTAVAGIGSSSGTVSGVSPGTATITYTSPVGCSATAGIIVTTSPCPLTLTSVCAGGATTFTNCIGGGLWSSSNTSVATIGSLSGAVSGMAVGTATISYSFGSSTCTVTGTISVTAGITPITGPSFTCIGSTVTLSNATPGGTWSSSNPSVASVTGGVVTGAGTGVATITYTATGCVTTKDITVNALPAGIAGPSSMCGSTCIPQTNTVAGGIWTSSSTTVATVGSSTGLVCGISSGVANITYSIGGCFVTKAVTVLVTPAPISGSTAVCTGSTSTLTNSIAGGTWSSGSITIATIGSTGIVNGLTLGTSVITYTLGSGCSATTTVTVVSAPAPITGLTQVCVGDCIAMANATPGGVWSSTPTATGTISSAGIYCGVSTGVGTITYSIGTCRATTVVTVSPAPSVIAGPGSVCMGESVTLTNTIPGGLWGSNLPSIATVDAVTGVVTGVSGGTAIISYAIGSCTPAIAAMAVNAILPITGSPMVCIGEVTHLSDAALGGSWSSSATGIATVNPSGDVTGVGAGMATITYTMPTGCFATLNIIVNPSPATLTGPGSVCIGQTIALGPPTLTGGTWISSNPAIAAVSTTGAVTGTGTGSAIISYQLASTGCSSLKTVTVYPNPPGITGASHICTTMCATLSNLVTGGTWSTSSSFATVGATTGIVCGGTSAGPAIISFTSPGTGCVVTKTVDIVLPPATLTGPDNVCAYSTISLGSATVGGTWASSNTTIATVDGAGNVYGNAAGTAVISYTLGCSTTKPVTVNLAPPGITGTTTICVGITTHLSNPLVGGRWYSMDTTIAKVDSMTGIVTGVAVGGATIVYTLSNGCAATVTIIVSPGITPITGGNTVCVGTATLLSNITPGGTWTSSAPTVASVSGAGLVTGLSLGVTTISYTVGSFCPVSMVVSVNANPGPITGAPAVCVGSIIPLANTVSGGVWSSSNTAIATIHTTTGALTGVAAGIVDITYTMGASCFVTKNIVVDPLPAPITGPNTACATHTLVLSDITPGGLWSSASTGIATVGSASGIVTGMSGGVALISYTIGTGCAAVYPVTINPMPAPISGSSAVCLSGTTTLTNALTGGTWSSSSAAATVGSSSGVVTGVSLGTTTITYQLAAGCFVTKTMSVSPLPGLFTVTGGGNYCGGGAGVHIGITGSEVGVNYMLHLGATAVGAFTGTGAPIDFGLHTVTGTYTVTGTSTATGCSITMTGTATVGITPFSVPSVTLAITPSDTICNGATVLFTPVPVNGGPGPVYRWRVNGTPVAVSATYSFIPANGDVVTVTMTSNALCPLPDTATYAHTMVVTPFGTPTVNLAPTPNDTVCMGTPVTVNAIPVFGGAAPIYTWVHNGLFVSGTTSYSFVPNDNDEVFCIMSSNYPCRYANIDTSTKMTFNVDSPKVPSVFLGATPGTTILLGQTDTLFIVTDAINPTYQWYLNGFPIAGATTSTYISSSFSYPDRDSVSCLVTSNGGCVVSTHKWVYITVYELNHQGVAGINNGDGIFISPNPSKGRFIIKGSFGSAETDNITLEITNMLGQTVYTSNVGTLQGKINEQVQLPASIANGMYILMLRAGAESRAFHLQVNQ